MENINETNSSKSEEILEYYDYDYDYVNKSKEKKNKNIPIKNTESTTDKQLQEKTIKAFNFKNICIFLLRLALIVIILFCVFKIILWYRENSSNNKLINNIRSEVISQSTEQSSSESNVDFNSLKSKNSDSVAWIKVNNTDIDFPVVKAKDNDYYLTHNFNKEYNSAGWIFGDYRNNFDGTDKHLIIYGHNRRDGSMFSTLNKTLKEDWYTNPDNQIIELSTPSGLYKYQIFSIYTITNSEFSNTVDFKNEYDYKLYLNSCLNKSIFDFKNEVSTSDSILTLYTCANDNQFRIILHAKQLH